MTITSYQIEGVLKAYSRQNKPVSPQSKGAEAPRDLQSTDVVELSLPLGNKEEVFEKISYSLVDIFVKAKKK